MELLQQISDYIRVLIGSVAMFHGVIGRAHALGSGLLDAI